MGIEIYTAEEALDRQRRARAEFIQTVVLTKSPRWLISKDVLDRWWPLTANDEVEELVRQAPPLKAAV